MASQKVTWFLDARTRPHLERINSPLLKINRQPNAVLAATEQPIARRDPFGKYPRSS
jgi:hypothetical protein